ncbi:C4-dicarboxylate-binding periplasmic protein precursor [Anaerotignum neopropionicum]|uniref:C4-dicarboxylate-binding periplasmic protein n=1 Tax=Anaerotignum neopropionicum TaxID=36847 RepID=A0A136WIQ9_9FIRM|nr:TRAP transporter substrate-binding protein DctP [Anaerotignum neopropionicum]KXL54219.1 C4-dicarboxylate-binding periplasmic protein precursor [Anaerotignum neopropionicum]KXL54344.1 C4-dicarboxylate-binding periplasmic protein precursor [Anaerotignum neopropionicum]
MKKLLSLLLTSTMVLALAGCGSGADSSNQAQEQKEEQTVTLSLAHIRPVGSTADLAIQAFAEEATELSGGTLQFEVYPASQLGDYTTVQERVGIGDVDMQIASLGSNLDKVFAMSNAAYLCSTWDEAKVMFAGNSPLIEIYKEKMAKYNMTYLASYPLYFGGIALNTDPVDPTNPNARSGIKIRVPAMSTFEKTATTLGYLATPLASSEMFTSIQTGVVNGAIGAGAEMYYGNLSGLVKYYLPINDHFEQWYMYINTDKWNSLSDNQRNALQTAADNMQKARWDVAEGETDEYEQKLRDSGTIVVDYTDEQLGEFAKVVREAVWPAIAEEYGTENFEAVTNSIK